MSAARAPWACVTPELTLTGILRGKGKGWRVTKFHFQAAQKTRCEQTALRRRDPAICCRGAAEKPLLKCRGSQRARRGQGGRAIPQKVSLRTSGKRRAACRAAWGESRPRQKAPSAQRRVVSSRFTHFTWHLSLVLQMLRCISDRASNNTAVWTHVHFPLNKPQEQGSRVTTFGS